MISQNCLVCALAPWVWEKHEQYWDKTAGHKGLSELLLLLGLGTLSHCCTGLQSSATSGFAHSYNQLYPRHLEHQQLNLGQAAEQCLEIISEGKLDERGAFGRHSVKRQKTLLAPWLFDQGFRPSSPHPAQQASALTCLPVQHRLCLSMLSTPHSPWAHWHSPEWITGGSTSESGFGHMPQRVMLALSPFTADAQQHNDACE